jgi:hypothetical protein
VDNGRERGGRGHPRFLRFGRPVPLLKKGMGQAVLAALCVHRAVGASQPNVNDNLWAEGQTDARKLSPPAQIGVLQPADLRVETAQGEEVPAAHPQVPATGMRQPGPNVRGL